MDKAKFWNKLAHKYAASPVKDMKGYEDTLARARHYLKSDDHLLEVGCGTGTTALTLSKSVAAITAIDVSETMLEIAEGKREKQKVSNVTFIPAEIMTPVAGAPFDAICAFSILHLADGLPETLMHLRDQLKPGGYVISKTVCLKEMNRFMPLLLKLMQAIGKAPHVTMLTAEVLENSFRRTGFEIVEAGYFGTNKFARFVVARKPE
ncbi:hypothetical protein AL073_07810 [Loktanella sp. 1ANDIMAR09]|nr:hypothetical protein AL073_07810 [Loktanella sp. 1ANDIMAR09]